MTFLKAAESVLKETKRPMRPEEIVKLAIEKGWLGRVEKQQRRAVGCDEEEINHPMTRDFELVRQILMLAEKGGGRNVELRM